MKSTLRLLSLFLLMLPALLRAATDPAALRAMDDARVAAMIAGDPAQLAKVFSEELLYVHSSGNTDTKESFIAALTSGRTKYNTIRYEQREFREVVPGLVLMHGRGRFTLGKAAPFTELHLSFLAAYRLEQGNWRLIGWQSCRLPEAPAGTKR